MKEFCCKYEQYIIVTAKCRVQYNMCVTNITNILNERLHITNNTNVLNVKECASRTLPRF